MKSLLNSNKELTMSSLEIAELTGKQHKTVLRDTRVMLVQLHGEEYIEDHIPDSYRNRKSEWISQNAGEILNNISEHFSHGTDMYHEDKRGFKWKRDKRGYISEFHLDKQYSITLVSGYKIKFRKQIIDRWIELEEKNPPKTQAEALLGTVELLVKQEKRLEQLELEKTRQNSINDQVATQLKKLEIDTRNGVPTGFLSRSQAYRLHGKALSTDISEQALTSLEVQTKKYIHTENDRSTQTFGWNEDQIETCIMKFIKDSAQVTKTQCESQLLNGKRFRYLKVA